MRPMDQFQLIRELGRGATGTVYQARQIDPEREVALKLVHVELSEDRDTHARFEREARTLAGLAHPGVVRVFDFGISDGQMFYAMELLRGNDLWEHVLDRKRLQPPEVFAALAQAADALAYLHDQGLAHREVKPQNVFLEADGRVVLTGFGLVSRGAADQPDDVRRLALVAHAVLSGDMSDPPDPAKLEGVPDWFRELQARALDRRAAAAQYRDVLYAKIDAQDRGGLVVLAGALPSRLMRVPAMRGLPGTQPLIRSRGDKPLRSGRVKVPMGGVSRGVYQPERRMPRGVLAGLGALLLGGAAYLVVPVTPPPPSPSVSVSASPAPPVAPATPSPPASASVAATAPVAPTPPPVGARTNPVIRLDCWPSERDVVVDFTLARPAACALELTRESDGTAQKLLLPEARAHHHVFTGLSAGAGYVLRVRLADGTVALGAYAFDAAPAARASEVAKATDDSPPDLRLAELLRKQLAGTPDSATLRRAAFQAGRLADRATADLLEPFVDKIGLDAAPVRGAVIEALARARHPRAAELARRWIAQSADPTALAGCAYALAEAGGRENAQPILDALARNPARVELAPLAARADAALALTTFREWLAANAGQSARAPAAVAGLAWIGEPSVDALATACRGGVSTPTALGALEALASIPGERAQAALLEACRAAPSEPNRLWIVGRRGLTALAPLVARAAESSAPATRRDALCVLALLSGAAERPRFERALADTDREVSLAGAWGLVRAGGAPPRAVELLRDAVVGPGPFEEKRRLAGEALGQPGALVPITEWERTGVTLAPGDVVQVQLDAVIETPVKPALALVVGGQATRLRPGRQSVLVTHAGEALVRVEVPARRGPYTLHRLSVRRGE